MSKEDEKKGGICPIAHNDLSDVEELAELFDRTLGAGYLDEDALKSALCSTEETDLKIFVKKCGDEIEGAFTVKVLTEAERTAFETNVTKNGGEVDLSGVKTGLLSSCSVNPKYRRKGLGYRLIERGHDYLLGLQCEAIVGTSWESSSPDNSKSLLERLGCHSLISVPNYWTKLSMEEGVKCPDCGDPPCYCSATFYLKRIRKSSVPDLNA